MLLCNTLLHGRQEKKHLQGVTVQQINLIWTDDVAESNYRVVSGPPSSTLIEILMQLLYWPTIWMQQNETIMPYKVRCLSVKYKNNH